MIRPYRQSPRVLRHGRPQRLTSVNIRNIYRLRNGWYFNKMFMRHNYRAYFWARNYGDSMEKALLAAAEERDWLDTYRRRILDRLQVRMVQVRGGKTVDVKRVVMEVHREVRRENRELGELQ